MTIECSIDENDFLTHQLYIASNSDRIKRKRKFSKVICPLAYVVLGALLLFQHHYYPAIAFVLFGLLWYIVYPIWERWYYVRHYRGFIKENYKDRFGRTATVEFNNDFIIIQDDRESESKLRTTEIEEINEIPAMILVKLKSGVSLILPKDKIRDIDLLKIRLKELAIYLNVNYNLKDEWKWK